MVGIASLMITACSKEEVYGAYDEYGMIKREIDQMMKEKRFFHYGEGIYLLLNDEIPLLS